MKRRIQTQKQLRMAFTDSHRDTILRLSGCYKKGVTGEQQQASCERVTTDLLNNLPHGTAPGTTKGVLNDGSLRAAEPQGRVVVAGVPLPPARQPPRTVHALLSACTHMWKETFEKQQGCIQLCKLYRDKHRLRDEENFLSFASLNDCCCTRRVFLSIHKFASLQLFLCMLSGDPTTNLQEKKSLHLMTSPCNFSLLEN